MTTTTNKKQVNVLLCVSGSVATLKIPELINQLSNQIENINIKLLFSSEKAKYFFEKSKLYDPNNWSRFLGESTSNSSTSNKFFEVESSGMIIYEEDEWNLWQQIGDPVLHIELRKWVDIVLIAPASANLLAKVTAGMADSLLLSMLRAINLSSPSSSLASNSLQQQHRQQQVFICPAMNTAMWSHPCTNQQINQLEKWGYHIIPPISKKLACGDEGVGALALIDTIVETVKAACKHISHQNDDSTTTDANNNNSVKNSGSGNSSSHEKNNDLDILLQRAASIRRSHQRNLYWSNVLYVTGVPMIIGISIGATLISLLFGMKKK